MRWVRALRLRGCRLGASSCWLPAIFGMGVVLALGVRVPHEPGWRDGPEINLAGRTLSILHPPGAPLHTLLARAVVVVTGATEDTSAADFSVNMLSAASWALAAAAAMALAMREAGGATEGRREWCRWGAGLAAGAWVLLAPGTRDFATTGEVYAPAALVTLLALGASRARRWRVGAYAIGLGAAIHPLLVGLLPLAGTPKRWVRGVPLIFLGGSIFLLLPLRSHFDPLLDWGDPETGSRLWAVLSAREFSQGLTGLGYAEVEPWRRAWESLGGGFGAPGFLLALSGLAMSGSAGWMAAVLISVGGAVYFGGGVDVEGYLMIPRVLLAPALGVSFRGLGRVSRSTEVISGFGVAVLSLVGAGAGWPSGATGVGPYQRRLAAPLPANAIWLTENTVDYFCGLDAAARMEVSGGPTFIYTPLLGWEWYRDELRGRRPDLSIVEPPRDGPAVAVAVAKQLVSDAPAPVFYSPAEHFIFPVDRLVPWGLGFAVCPGPADSLWTECSPKPDHGSWDSTTEELRVRLSLVELAWAREAMGKGRAPEAVERLQQALRWNENDGAITLNLARALRRTGRPLEAAAMAERAWRQGVDSAAADYTRALALWDAGRPNLARTALSRALTTAPDRAGAWCVRSRWDLLEGRPGPAVEAARQAIGVEPQSAAAHAALGAALVGAGQMDAAKGALERAHLLGSTDPAVSSLLEMLLRRGQEPG